ncbi:hypothetical protein K491DRAFT_388180 [Lophiostoma macrostomum CBS 122681]|uniref:Uncharacterized protein n=1 Tax=Lophiostoma macrostomum CBS 122681 TaxID=1314788 RepID=A0A6A6TP50_9PLEO|nr:hypothetical protein K491DRAFT_388180 [Lophiostoma macrostomum CBS 122681]
MRSIRFESLTSTATVCPGPTAITIGGQTHTVTEATTLTISACSCTITKPVAPSAPAYSTEAPSAPVTTEVPVESYPVGSSSAAPSAPASAPYPSANGTLITVAPPTGTGRCRFLVNGNSLFRGLKWRIWTSHS